MTTRKKTNYKTIAQMTAKLAPVADVIGAKTANEIRKWLKAEGIDDLITDGAIAECCEVLGITPKKPPRKSSNGERRATVSSSHRIATMARVMEVALAEIEEIAGIEERSETLQAAHDWCQAVWKLRGGYVVEVTMPSVVVEEGATEDARERRASMRAFLREFVDKK